MKKLIICGVCGAMGKTLCSVVRENDYFSVVCGVDKNAKQAVFPFPVYERFSSALERGDILVDFSSSENVSERLTFAMERKIGVVIATTGFSETDKKEIKKAANTIPIFYAENYSPAVFVMQEILPQIASKLSSFDILLTEKHHKRKKDAPSGTAKALLSSLSSFRKEIPVFSARVGTIVGEHEVVFAGEEETLTITHRAENKRLFAVGALKAANFLLDKKFGFYTMRDLFS